MLVVRVCRRLAWGGGQGWCGVVCVVVRGGHRRWWCVLLPIVLLTSMVDSGGRRWQTVVGAGAGDGLVVMSWWSCFPRSPLTCLDMSGGFSTLGKSFARHSLLSRQCRNTHTTGKHHSFIGVFKFIGTDEYIQIIFVRPKIDEYKFIFVGFDWELTNIWAIRFDFNRTHIFIGEATSLTNIRALYSLVTWPHQRI
jgi:hypothetical protein